MIYLKQILLIVQDSRNENFYNVKNCFTVNNLLNYFMKKCLK